MNATTHTQLIALVRAYINEAAEGIIGAFSGVVDTTAAVETMATEAVNGYLMVDGILAALPPTCDCPLDPHHRWNCPLTPIWAQTMRELDCNPWTVMQTATANEARALLQAIEQPDTDVPHAP